MIYMTRDDRFLDDDHGMQIKNPSVFSIEKVEQRSVIKFIILKDLGAKVIYRELITVLTSTDYSMSQVKSRNVLSSSNRVRRHVRTNREPIILLAS
jgi:hypothetical protein